MASNDTAHDDSIDREEAQQGEGDQHQPVAEATPDSALEATLRSVRAVGENRSGVSADED